MKSTKKILGGLLLALFFVGLSASTTIAQPSDAQLRRDLNSPKAVSVVFHKPGARVWSSSYSKYVWDIGYTVKLKSDIPGVFIVVRGISSYDIIGGRYRYWKDFTTDNTYEGLPNPTADDVQAILRQFGVEKILGSYAGDVVGEIESIGLAKEPKYEWHTLNSVSFNLTAVYTEKIAGGGQQHLARTFRVRLYREDMKSAWNSLLSDSIGEENL